MSEQTVTAYLYKEHSNFNEFCKKIGTLSSIDAAKLTNELLSYPVDNSCCVSTINITTTTNMRKKVTKKNGARIQSSNTLIISDFYNDEMKFPCINDDKERARANLDDYNRISYCHGNLSTGKCKCNFFANTIGKYMYPQYYGKVK